MTVNVRAVATDAAGCPIVNNSLIGDEYVKFATGHHANLGAEAVSALAAPACDPTASSVDLLFNNVQYGALPRVLALSIAAAVPAAASSMRPMVSGSGEQEKPQGVRISWL